MTLLITGGCGFLGSNLALSEIRRGGSVVILDNLSRIGVSNNLMRLKESVKLRFFNGDVRDKDLVERIVAQFKPKSIFHLAGQVAMTTSIADPRLDFEVNALGTLNILEAVRKFCSGSNVIYSSTNKVYGDLEQFRYIEAETRYRCLDRPSGFDESTPLDFHSPYGCSKGTGDQYMLDYHRVYGLRTMVFRHSSMYGGMQHSTVDQGWIGWFCERAVEQKATEKAPEFSISGNGKQVRDVLHADDMVKLYESAVVGMDSAAGEAFNIGGGIDNSLSLLELMTTLETLLQVNLRYYHIDERKSDQKVFVADTAKAEKLLNWRPTINVETGLLEIINWITHEKPAST